MKIFLIATLIGASVIVGASSAASADDKQQAKTRKITADYASCVVRKHHAKASESILATASNYEITHQFAQIIDADCLGNAAGLGVDMTFPNDSYRYAVADALVNADFANRGITSFVDRLPLAQPEFVQRPQQLELLAKAKGERQRKDVQKSIEKNNALTWVSRFGECVVRQDPVNARYWLLTYPDTPEETSRIKALQPAFSSCVGEGTIKFNRIIVRGTVAINYYRLAMATVQPGAGSPN